MIPHSVRRHLRLESDEYDATIRRFIPGYETMLSIRGSANGRGDARRRGRSAGAMIRGAETLVERARDMYVKPGNIVHLFDWGGDVDRTLEWLERSYELRDSELAYMATPLLASDALRADPRFHNLLRRLDLPVPVS